MGEWDLQWRKFVKSNGYLAFAISPNEFLGTVGAVRTTMTPPEIGKFKESSVSRGCADIEVRRTKLKLLATWDHREANCGT